MVFANGSVSLEVRERFAKDQVEYKKSMQRGCPRCTSVVY